MDKKGFVAIFNRPFTQQGVVECIEFWLERFEKVEQIAPKMEFTLELKKADEILWDPSLQFRISSGEQFAWAYITLEKVAMETTGFQDAEISFCLEILLELPGVTEVVDEKNQRRLDELEKSGVI